MSFTAIGSNAPLLKRQNRAAVLRGVLGAGPLSRRALCRKTGLTASTITHIVGELIGAGLIRELGVVDPAERPARVGRREVMIDLEPLGGVVVGGHIGVQRTVLAVGDLRAGMVSNARFATQAEQGPASVVRRIAAEIPSLLERAGVSVQRVLGLGMGIVGPVDVGIGVLSSSPELGWRDVPLRALLQEATGLPTVVDSGRRGMALAEMMFGGGQGVRNFMLVHIGSTIVAGIVADQQLYRGATGDGGSIGHLTIAGVDRRCRCGRIGCLDTVSSEAAIEERAWELAWQAPGTTLARAMAAESEALPRQRLYAAAQEGDPAAVQILLDAARWLGEGIANVMSVLDSDLVLIGGEVTVACPAFVDTVRSVVAARAYRSADGVTRVLPSAFGADLRLFGGLALALHDLFYAPSLRLLAPGWPGARGRTPGTEHDPHSQRKVMIR
jgi:predicted NBD/HSP70 family sugar kinase